jgi:hypothetical protein
MQNSHVRSAEKKLLTWPELQLCESTEGALIKICHVQVTSHRRLTPRARFRSQSIQCEIRGGQNGTDTCSPSFDFSGSRVIPPLFHIYSSLGGGGGGSYGPLTYCRRQLLKDVEQKQWRVYIIRTVHGYNQVQIMSTNALN